ncbi:MAG: hypothetical protein JNL83_13785 [Myxococcales bacterium]|nr:hypothetical protein [Myxococcales bacterium]
MGRGASLAIVACTLVVRSAHAQPGQQPEPPYLPPWPTEPPPPPAPEPRVESRTTSDPVEEEPPEPPGDPWTAAERVRLISSIGVSGNASPSSDLETTIGFGTRVSWRVHELVTFGIHDHLLLRNWRETGRYYGYISDCEKIDTRCDRRADYWAIGWAMAFSTAQVGWDVTFRREGSNEPWISAGSALMVYSSGRGIGEEGSADLQIAHAGTLGVGFDFEVIGVGLRASYAADWTAFAASGPPILSVLVSIDVLLPLKHPDRYWTRPRR